MMDDDVKRLLDQLSSSAETLHAETQTIGSIILDIEQKLRGMDLGIEAWLTEHPLWKRELSVSASNVAPRRELQLGFAPNPGARTPTANDWCLQLREAEVTPSTGVSPGEESQQARIHRQFPLSKGSREDQVASLKILPKILQHLVALAQERIDTIREAKKLI